MADRAAIRSAGDLGEATDGGARTVGLPPQVLEALKWVATTVGVTGILLVLGFVSDFAYEHRLGYSISSEDPTGYCTEAGRFLLTLIIVVFTSAARHWVGVAAATILLFGAGLVWRRLSSRVRPNIAPLAALAILATLLLGNLIILDLPTVDLQSSLIAPVTPPPGVSARWPIGTLTRQVWLNDVCSRIELPQITSFQKLGGDCRYAPEIYQLRREDRFALNALITIGLAFPSLIAVQASRALRFSSGLSVLVVTLIILDLLLLPYSYAKTVRLTQADDVKVTWIDAATQAQLGTQREFFLLYKTKDEVALLERLKGEVWIIPSQQVRLIQIVDQEDVLSFVIGKKLAGVNAGPAPP